MQAQDLTAQGMEEGVAEARNLLIFLSDDCFGRPFCNAEQRWGLLYGCHFVGVVEKDSRHHPADFGAEKQRAPPDLKRLLDEVEYLEYRRRDFEAAAMVQELLRRGGVQAAAGPPHPEGVPPTRQPAQPEPEAAVSAEPEPEPEPEPEAGPEPEPQASGAAGGSAAGAASGGATPRDDYGLANAEDFARVYSAKVVHIISTPYDKANPVAGRKAVETKQRHDNPAQGIYVFNPNTGLRAAAADQGLSEEEQGRQWLRLWTEVLQVVQATGGKCFVMAKRMGPSRCTLEGGAQSGEVNVAKFALDPAQAGHEGPAGWVCERIEYVLY
jgi:hypothetical protein